MIWTVYGLRFKGEAEARYIGFTKFTPAERLKRHLNEQIIVACHRPLIPWLRANRENVEAFAIAKCETQEIARATETLAIAFCLALGHRLLNGAQVPVHLRLPSERIDPRKAAA